ncbi:hypothetical protein QVD17_22951 [Tagetes erecta]|uniref:Uncharacterized protein n=1 Tax=Tagetes erecta TaxID=13708 RepID=A0AAD8KH21_TARER|nr:hypothetical protein QVD17_22951 [Tagetes erecta]
MHIVLSFDAATIYLYLRLTRYQHVFMCFLSYHSFLFPRFHTLVRVYSVSFFFGLPPDFVFLFHILFART